MRVVAVAGCGVGGGGATRDGRGGRGGGVRGGGAGGSPSLLMVRQVPTQETAIFQSRAYGKSATSHFTHSTFANGLQGFEWNKYNQTHYDVDNPPPKIVQGYRFNVR
jgi:hypothetical protein